MDPANQFKLTYYVGVMLAQGGVLSIKDESLVFAPNALERAVGAKDTVIPYQRIKLVDITGNITESLVIRTQEKAHRFVGGDPYKIRDKINQAIQNYVPQSVTGPELALSPSTPVPVQTKPAPAQVKTASAPSPSPARSTVNAVKTPTSLKCSSCSNPIRPEFHYCPFCKTALVASCPICYRVRDPNWKFCAFCGTDLTKPNS